MIHIPEKDFLERKHGFENGFLNLFLMMGPFSGSVFSLESCIPNLLLQI